MYKIAICDDRESILNKVHKLCEKYSVVHNEKLVVYTYSNPNKLLSDLEDKKVYDIFFIDIEMPQMNGLNLMKVIKSLYPESLIIILTSYAHYAIEAIELDVFRYLVKQKMSENFDIYLNAAIKRLGVQNEECYYINSPRKKIKIFCKDIIYCYKDKETKVTVFVTKNGEIRERKPLQDIWQDIRKFSDTFVFVERACFVNMFYISRISKNILYLDNGLSFKIGITYIDSLKKEVENFWRRRI